MFTIFTPFFTLGPAFTTLYSSHTLSHGLISSTTLYNTLQSTALQQFYSLQPLQHPSAPLTPPSSGKGIGRAGGDLPGMHAGMVTLQRRRRGC